MTADTELASNPDRAKNPRRVAAGKANRVKRGPLTQEGRARLRAAAVAGRPWEGSTGPVTAEGKALAAANGRVRQVGPVSVRQARREVAALTAVYSVLGTCRDTNPGRPQTAAVTPP